MPGSAGAWAPERGLAGEGTGTCDPQIRLPFPGARPLAGPNKAGQDDQIPKGADIGRDPQGGQYG